MPQRLRGRDFGRDNVFGQYIDSLSRDEYHELLEEYYRVGPLGRQMSFEDRLLEMVPDIEEFYSIYRERYRAGSCDTSCISDRNLTDAEPDIVDAHDIICLRLFVDDEDTDPEIGKNKGPHRYRIAPRRNRDQRFDIRPGSYRQQSYASSNTGSSGADSLADYMGGFGLGGGSRAGYGRSNLGGRGTRRGQAYRGGSRSYGYMSPYQGGYYDESNYY